MLFCQPFFIRRWGGDGGGAGGGGIVSVRGHAVSIYRSAQRTQWTPPFMMRVSSDERGLMSRSTLRETVAKGRSLRSCCSCSLSALWMRNLEENEQCHTAEFLLARKFKFFRQIKVAVGSKIVETVPRSWSRCDFSQAFRGAFRHDYPRKLVSLFLSRAPMCKTQSTLGYFSNLLAGLFIYK